MASNYTIEVHRHRETPGAYAQLPHVVGFSYMESTEGSAVFNVRVKVPLRDLPNAVRVGDWVVVRQRSGVCVAFGHVDTVSGGISVAQTGAVSAAVVQVGCSSWFDFLGKSSIYVPAGDVDTRGTLLSLKDWLSVATSVYVDYFFGSVGVALSKVHASVARIRLPASLGGEYIGDAIPVVHDEETQRRYAPLRVVEQVTTVGGVASQFMSTWQNAKLQELYFNSFVPDGMMIEMFPSLEVPAEELDATQQHLVPGPEYRPLSKLAQHLGRTPCLIYRMRPWRARPLIESAVVDAGFVPDVDDKVLAGGDVPPRNQSPGVGSNRYEQAQLLGEYRNGKAPMFSEVTWDTRRARPVPASAVRNLSFGWDDSRRTNCASVSLANSSGTSYEAQKDLGLPITNDRSILEHGVRYVRPTWPFIFTRDNDTLWTLYMRSIAAQKMQFAHVGHAMSEGDIDLNWRDADGSMLAVQAGEIVTTSLPGMDQPFYGYAQQVTHDVIANDGSGAVSARTTVKYIRGLFGIEAARDAEFSLSPGQATSTELVAGGARATLGAQTSSGVLDGSVVVAAARELWLKGYINSYHTHRRPATLDLINRLFSTPEGINWRTTINGHDYSVPWTHETFVADQALGAADQMSNYCGAFAAYCWRAAGLALPLREQFFAGVGRLTNYANYIATPNTAGARWQRPADGTGRKVLELGPGSTAADVTAFGVEPGDILLLGSGAHGARAASHIAIIESFDAATGLFTTYEGNASPGKQATAYPDGSRDQTYGVVHRTRPVGDRYKELYAMRVIRPSVHDLEEL